MISKVKPIPSKIIGALNRISSQVSSRHLPKLLETNLDALIPRTGWNTIIRDGKIRSEYAVPFARLFCEVHAVEGKSQQWLLSQLGEEGVVEQPEKRTTQQDHYSYRRLVFEEWVARKRVEDAVGEVRRTLEQEIQEKNRYQRKFEALTEALLELHKLGISESERQKALVSCVVKGLGYSGVRGYDVDLRDGTWFEFLSHGEQVVSRFSKEPARVEGKEAKAFLTKLIKGGITPEMISDDEKQGLYSWHAAKNWAFLHIPDRSKCYFVDGQRIAIDKQAYQANEVQEVMFLVLGNIKEDEKVKVYQITNWAKGAPLFTNMESDLMLLHTLAEALAVSEKNISLNNEIEMMSRTDAKTGLWNMRYFEGRLIEDLKLAKRLNQPLSILMIDIDHLTQHNTRYGHPFADLIIEAVAQAIQGAVREIDTVVRYGGDEILVILLGADSHGAEAMTVGERICEAVRNLDMMFGNKKVDVSVSIGVANSSAAEAEGLLEIALELRDQKKLQQFPLVQKADEALYESKKAGRDRVTLKKS